jgi:uncharacterized membrane protein
MNVVEKNGRALLVVAPFVIALIIIWVIYDPFHMLSGKPPGGNTAFAQLPLWLWVIGIGILGSFICYGILQAGRRSRGQGNTTRQATEDLYRREEADRERQGLP